MSTVNCGSHAVYQHFVVTNLRKYYPNPNTFARSTQDIIERFWNLDLSFTDTIIFPLLNPASRHDFRGFLRALFQNEKRGIKAKYKNNFTIGKDGVPVCKESRRMNHDGS